MNKNIIRLIINRLNNFTSFIRNMRASRSMANIPYITSGEYIFSGLQPSHISTLDDLHRLLREGKSLSFWQKILLKYRGGFFCGIVMDNSERMIGFQLHAFLKNELKQGILHINFSGLLPQVRGKGLSSALRRHTASHYASQGIKSLSAYTTTDNDAALRAAEHIGYRVVGKPSGSRGVVKLALDLSECYNAAVTSNDLLT